VIKIIGKIIAGVIFGLIGLPMVFSVPIIGIPFVVLAGYLFSQAEKEHKEREHERTIKTKRKKLEENELDSEIHNVGIEKKEQSATKSKKKFSVDKNSKFCSECGQKNKKTAKFCSNCGKPQ